MKSGRPTGILYASVKLTPRRISGGSVPPRGPRGASVTRNVTIRIHEDRVPQHLRVNRRGTGRKIRFALRKAHENTSIPIAPKNVSRLLSDPLTGDRGRLAPGTSRRSGRAILRGPSSSQRRVWVYPSLGIAAPSWPRYQKVGRRDAHLNSIPRTMTLRFDRGTILMTDPSDDCNLAAAPGVVWDPRVGEIGRAHV